MSNTSRRFFSGLVVAAFAVPLAIAAQGPPLLASPGGVAGAQSVDLVGSWHLVSWVLGNGNPRCSEDEGGVSGLIVYTSDGHMSAQLGCSEVDVSDLTGLSPEAAAARLSRRHFTYYGTYTLDVEASTVTHHVEASSSVPFVGSDQVREYVFEGSDLLVLSPAGSSQKLTWRRNR